MQNIKRMVDYLEARFVMINRTVICLIFCGVEFVFVESKSETKSCRRMPGSATQ